MKSQNIQQRSAYNAAGLILLSSAFILSGCGKKPVPTPPPTGTAVEVVNVERGTVSSSIDVTGSVKALDDVTLSAKLGGRVLSVGYRQGARVGRGAVVVQQQTADMANQMSAGKAALAAAKVRLSQATTTSQWQDIQSEAAVKQAEQGLKSAQARLEIVRQGARPQERRQVDAALDSAQASFENAKINLARTKSLVDQGAVAKSNLDADQRSYDVAAAQLRSAQEQVSLIKAGARPEELQQAELAVRTAREQVARAQGDLKQRNLRTDDIRAAQAGVQQAQASLAMASQGLADSGIRSPIAGVVADRMVEPGEMVAPGTPLMRIYNPSTIYYEATVSEAQVDEVHTGQKVALTSDAIPGKVFDGSVVKIYPAANANNRSFQARIAITSSGELKPGMFAKGKVIVEQHTSALMLPRDAILNTPQGEQVFVVTDGTIDVPDVSAKPGKDGKLPTKKIQGKVAHRRSLEIGLDSDSTVEIIRGLNEGDTVVRTGQSYLQDGQAVRVLGTSSITPSTPEAK